MRDRWFQTWSAGVEHIFRDNKCPELPTSPITMVGLLLSFAFRMMNFVFQMMNS